MGEEDNDSKRQLRQVMAAARVRLPASEVVRCSAATCRRVESSPIFAQAGCVVAYRARDNEIDPSYLVEAARRAGKPIYYPSAEGAFRSAPGEGEPRDAGAVLGSEPDILFLVPGVAFDARGGRLGRGAGWYDRALARHRGTRVGLAYEFQVVPELPQAGWDVRMHAVATEARLVVQEKETHP